MKGCCYLNGFFCLFLVVHVFLTSFITGRTVLSKTQSQRVNLKSSSKYQSSSRNADLRGTSKRNQTQTETKDTAHAENHEGQDSDSQCTGAAQSQCLRRVTESVMSVELEAFYSGLSWYCLYQEEIF